MATPWVYQSKKSISERVQKKMYFCRLFKLNVISYESKE